MVVSGESWFATSRARTAKVQMPAGTDEFVISVLFAASVSGSMASHAETPKGP